DAPRKHFWTRHGQTQHLLGKRDFRFRAIRDVNEVRVYFVYSNHAQCFVADRSPQRVTRGRSEHRNQVFSSTPIERAAVRLVQFVSREEQQIQEFKLSWKTAAGAARQI